MRIQRSDLPGTAVSVASRLQDALIVFALFSGTLFAQTPTVGAPSTLSAGSVAQVIFGLVLVLALVGAVAWLLKRLSAFRAPGAGLIRVLAGAAVGQRERIVLVEVGETWLLVGVAPGHVTTLHSMPKMASASAPDMQTPATMGASFATWLNRKIEGRSHE